MEENLISVVLSVFCLMFVSLMLSLLYVFWWKPKMIETCLKEQGIHGPPYKFFIGDVKDLVNATKEAALEPTKFNHTLPLVEPYFRKTFQKYGKLYVCWLGPLPLVVIVEPELIKEMLFNKSSEILKPKVNSFMELFNNGLVDFDGDTWAKHRKIINPAFHIQKLKLLMPAISICCDEMIEKWEKLVGLEGSYEMDVFHDFECLTADVISRAAFGSSFEESKRIFKLQKEQGLLYSENYYMAIFPLLRFLPMKIKAKMRENYKEVRVLVKGIIEKRMKAIKMGKKVIKDDLLGILLESSLINENSGLTAEDVIQECRQFYFAGQETVANLLTWTMVMLCMYPDWQDQARAEVLNLLGKRKPTFDELTQLKTVTMILQEVLRLYPPTSLVRKIYKKTKLGEYLLPAGTQIIIPLQLLHRDPELWGKDVMEFNPRRFAEGISKATTNEQISYFPFGGGPRICIGQNFAMVESRLALAVILQRFSFEISPSYTHAPCISVTLQPKFGAQIILHKL